MEARLTEPNYNEILMYLGHRGQKIEDSLKNQISKCIDLVKESSRPAVIYKNLPVSDGKIDGLELEGNDLKELLMECHEVILFAITLGSDVEKLLMQYEIKDMADAFIMDACASAAVENVCNNFSTDIADEYKKKDIYITDRFSPGYGDLPIDIQGMLCDILNAQKIIGLSVNKNQLMIPRKSVSGFIGLSNKPQTMRKSGCENCSMFFDCEYRINGNGCRKE